MEDATRRAILALAALVAVAFGCDPIVGREGTGDPGGDAASAGENDIFDEATTDTGGRPPKDCGGGPYVFSVSASGTDPWQQSGLVAEQGATTLWLWKAAGGGIGALAGDFDLEASSDTSTFVVFAPAPPNLNVDREGLPQVYLAVGGCAAGPVLLGKVTVYGRPDTLRIRLAARMEKSVGVDCCGSKPGWPLDCDWFEAVRDTAAADTSGAGA